MGKVLILFIFCLSVTTNSYAIDVEVEKIFSVYCGFQFSADLTGKIISMPSDSDASNDKVKQLNFGFSDPLRGVIAKLYFTCDNKFRQSGAGRRPSMLIREEDAGGRYFRHVKWEKKYVAKNWEGRVAYIDYVYGDGVKTVLQQYVFCQYDRYGCFMMDVDLDKKTPKKIRDRIYLNLVSLIKIDG